MPPSSTDAPATAVPSPDDASAAAAASSGGRLKGAALKGSAITLITHLASTGIRFASNIILTRVLMPEQFGLMTLVNVFLVGLYLFSDIGVGPNIIQSRRGEDPLFLNTAWTVQVLRGLTLTLCAALLAWPLSRIYGNSALLALLPAAGLGALIGGLESTRLFTQNRELSFARISAVELISQVVGVGATIIGAWWTHSVWALVVGGLAGTATKTVLSHIMLPGVANRFAWDRDARDQLFNFGRWIFVSTAITFLAMQSDRMVLGKLVPAALLGIYSVAANLAALPTQIVQQLANRVFYPVVADSMRRPDHDPAAMRASRTRMLIVLAPMMGMGIALAPPVARLIYRENFHAVGPIVSLLAIGTWLGAIGTSYGIVVLAAGKPKFISFGNAIKFLFYVGLVWVVSPRWGIHGVSLLLSIAEIGVIGALYAGSSGLGVVNWKADVGTTLLVAVSAAICWGIHGALATATGLRVLPVVIAAGLALGGCAVLVRKLRLM